MYDLYCTDLSVAAAAMPYTAPNPFMMSEIIDV